MADREYSMYPVERRRNTEVYHHFHVERGYEMRIDNSIDCMNAKTHCSSLASRKKKIFNFSTEIVDDVRARASVSVFLCRIL